ncbi:hypothetical protein ACP70R_035521 [Stipagrostis hirtigluma subsp. patula]
MLLSPCYGSCVHRRCSRSLPPHGPHGPTCTAHKAHFPTSAARHGDIGFSGMPLRRLLGLPAAVSGLLRRGLSTAASHPPRAMMCYASAVESPARRASFKLAEPRCASHVLVPDHLLDPRPRPYGIGLLAGGIRAASGDGLLLLEFVDALPVFDRHGTDQKLQLIGSDMEFTRWVCNPVSGELFRLPDIDGSRKPSNCVFLGILTTQSESANGPPERYAVAWLSEDEDGEERSFVMRRFLSETGGWEKLVALPSPLPLDRRMVIDHEVLAFAGRLWWVDVSWGAVSVDPFSDRPDLRFVELPRSSVTEPVEGPRVLGRYRRMGVSEGRLRYAEVSQEEPFLLSSFSLDGDGSSWTLEHQVPITRLWEHRGDLCEEEKPRIGVVDPLSGASCILQLATTLSQLT